MQGIPKLPARAATGLALALLICCAPSWSEGASRPNIVLLLDDELGWSDLRSYGGEIPTPHPDRLGALALCQRIGRHTLGNRKAFSIVRVPSEEERDRAFTRQRQQIVRERQRLQAMGRSLLASHGIHVTGKWWTGRTWRLVGEIASAVVGGGVELRMPFEGEEARLQAAKDLLVKARFADFEPIARLPDVLVRLLGENDPLDHAEPGLVA